jgi:hypothetical protein
MLDAGAVAPSDAGFNPDVQVAGPPDAALANDAQPVSSSSCADDSLLLCLTFEGAVADGSPQRRATSAIGVTLVPGSGGSADLAAKFGGGSESFISVSDTQGFATSVITVELDIRPDAFSAGRMGLFDSDGWLGLFLLPSGQINCRAGAASLVAGENVSFGAWQRVGCVWDGRTLAIYINGRRVARENDVLPTAYIAPVVRVGSNSPSGDGFVGLMDNVRVWSRASF